MPDSPHEDPLTDTQETLPQRATQRSNAIAFLGKWKRDHALKLLSAAVLRNKAHNLRHNAFTTWIKYTKTKTNTANLAARIVHTSLAEALALHFNDGWQHAQDSSAARLPQVQLFLRGAADGTLKITVPVPITRNQLHQAIAKRTLVPPQEQSLGSMYQYADAHNADLFYLEDNCTLDVSSLLRGGSGGPRLAKQAKPLLPQSQKFFIYVHGPDRHQNTVGVMPSDKIRRVKELLANRVVLQPSSQTLFLNGQQLDDNLILEEGDIVQGTTLQLLRAFPPENCEEHHKRRDPEHLMQRYDPDLKWIWVCCPGTTCRMQGPSNNNVGAASNALTQHPVPPQATRAPKHAPRANAAAETPAGPQLQTPLPVGTRVYARFDGDNEEYPATILDSYADGHLVAYDIEPTASYKVVNAHLRPMPPTV
jgi:hypothetical protein